MREAANTLAMNPDAVATTASTTVNQTPLPPNAGRAAWAREKVLGGNDLGEGEVACHGSRDGQIDDPQMASEINDGPACVAMRIDDLAATVGDDGNPW